MMTSWLSAIFGYWGRKFEVFFQTIIVQLDAIAITRDDLPTREQVDQIIALLTPPPSTSPAVAFRMTVETANSQGEKQMAKAKGKMKISILGNGTAQATLTAVDASGLTATYDGAPPTWASSDPGVNVAPAADGLSAILSPATPPVLVTGAIITATGALQDGTAVVGDNTSNPVNVIAGPAGSFVMSVA